MWQVEPDSAPARAGIQPGDEIQSVDAVAVPTLIQKKLGRQQSSHAGKLARGRAFATLLDGAPGSAARVVWRGKDGKSKSAAFQRYWMQRPLGFQVNARGKYLVIEIETFTRALTFDLVWKLRNRLGGARGLILDLRRNGGGDAVAMAEVAAAFLGEGVGLGGFTDRAGASFQLTTHSKSSLALLPELEQRIPLIVLISERTSSAAEILASALQTQGRAKLLGTPTCGCVMAIRSRHSLPDEGVLDVSEFDYRTVKGVRLEGLGVQPDKLLVAQRRDLYAKRDRGLEAAIELLKSITNTTRQ